MSLAKQLNGIRRMIVNKKDKASVFWWEDTKNSAVPASIFSDISITVKKCKETLGINRISQKIREAYLHILKAAPAAERGILGVNRG